MSFRPNFTDVQLNGDKLEVFGESNEDDLDNIVGIQVVISQEDKAAGGSAHIAAGFVPEATASWSAEIDSAGFVAGPAVAIGVETHSSPVTAITWAQLVEIQE
jgi:hypothetical protein